MKQLILIFIMFALVQTIQAQDNPKQYDIEWFDAENKIVDKQRFAKYVQRIYSDGRFAKLNMQDVIIQSGKYVSKEDRRYHGEISYFNKKGNLSRIDDYDKGKKLEFPIYTMDIQQDYDFVKLLTYNLGYSNDGDNCPGSLDYAIRGCKEALILMCKEKGGDAIIGLKIEIQNPQKNEYHSMDGKILVYGTAVKLK